MCFLVAQLFRKPLAAENLRMHPHHQHFLVIGAIEDADPPAFGKPQGRPPEKIMLQFLGAGLLETENLAALRIDPGHDVPDGAIFSGGVHSLKDQQQRITVGCVVKLLQVSSTSQRVPQGAPDTAPSTCKWVSLRSATLRLTFFPGRTQKSFELIFIFAPSGSPTQQPSPVVRDLSESRFQPQASPDPPGHRGGLAPHRSHRPVWRFAV